MLSEHSRYAALVLTSASTHFSTGMMSQSAQEDFERCLQEAEEERAEQRAKLFLPVGEKVDGFVIAGEGEDAPKLVEEVESLCMNCHENVGAQ